MKPLTIVSLLAGALAGVVIVGASARPASSADINPDAAQYDASGRFIPPTNYRDWVFLSSGMDMSYTAAPAMPGSHMFDNVFAPRAAYEAFKQTGVWPDGTVLMLEARGGASKGSINQRGEFQTAEIMGAETHVKDSKRFTGGWAFFGAEGGKPSTMIPYAAACYSCHQQHAAADTTFVQFYPTLLPIATRLGTLNSAYVKETAGQ